MLQEFCFEDVLSSFLPLPLASLVWACFFVACCWIVGLWLYKKKIYIKL